MRSPLAGVTTVRVLVGIVLVALALGGGLWFRNAVRPVGPAPVAAPPVPPPPPAQAQNPTLPAASPAPPLPPPPPDVEFDMIIAGGMVVDGSGKVGFRTDVGIRQGRITHLGDLSRARTRRRLAASGLVVAPGFINPHTHTWDPLEPTDPDGKSSLMQGLTTEFGGVDGRSLWPIGKQLAEIAAEGTGVNYGTFAGQGTVRGQVLGEASRAATATELARMEALVEAAMVEGAFGLSSGLEYVPGKYAGTAEIVALARVAAARGGIYSTHMRSEGDRILEALDEALQIGREARIPVNLSHFKVVYPRNWPQFEQVLARVKQARDGGQSVFADVYPYLAPDYATTLRLGDAYRGYDPSLLVFRAARDQTLVGRTLGQVAKERAMTPETLARQIMTIEQPLMVAEVISEPQMLTLLGQPWSVVGTDGEAAIWHEDPGQAVLVHPRSYGTYPRILGRYVREQKRLSLADAVRKMSGAVADHFGLTDRGYIRTGYWADVVVFDPTTIIDRATWQQPQQYPTGIRFVLVNGTVAVDGGQPVPGVRAGKILRPTRR